jgi:acetyl esterase/lipase
VVSERSGESIGCNRRAALGVVAGFAGSLLVSSSLGDAAASRADDDAAVAGRYRYGPHPSQYVEVSLPPGSDAAPVVVIVHGGFWQTGFDTGLGYPLAIDLARRGFAAANVEYRRVGPNGGGGWPQTGQDVAAAVDALRTDGQQLTGGRLDLSRVVGLGHSAGGQLAAWAAARRSSVVRLTGVVSQAGVLDLVRAAETGVGGDAVNDLMGGSPAQKLDAYADASPIARTPLGVPSICVHGRDDTTVPIEQSERFVSTAVQRGDRSELRPFDGDHFEPITVDSPAWALSVAALTDLMQS